MIFFKLNLILNFNAEKNLTLILTIRAFVLLFQVIQCKNFIITAHILLHYVQAIANSLCQVLFRCIP